MMQNSSFTLDNQKIAILVAGGFEQNVMVAAQKKLLESGASVSVVSVDQGLVGGWDGTGWGHNFPVDVQLNTALAADFDMLVIPGGMRSMDKLKTTAHTKRFVSGFVAMDKPVAVFNQGVIGLVIAECATDLEMCAMEAISGEVKAAGANVTEGVSATDGSVMSFVTDEKLIPQHIADMCAFFEAGMMTVEEKQAA